MGDGDSKAVAILHDRKPYGDTTIIKHVCIGHIQKHVGRHACNLKENKGLKDDKGERPKFAHCLTDAKID